LEGDPCPYCQQPLVDEALALVRKYRAYNNSEPKRALDDAAEALRRLAAPLVRLQPGPVRDACGKRAAASDGGPAAVLLTKTASFLGEIVSAQTAVAAGRPFDGAALSASASTLNGELREVIRKIDDLVETLRGEAQGRRKALDQASAQLRTLENRMLLRELQRELRRGVEGEKWAAAAGTLLDKRLPPLLRSLTEQSKEASSKLLDQDFGRLFEDECKALCAPKVRLDFTGRRGEAARKKVVAPNRRPSEILSEGEQKVIALADFLAETTLHHKSAPIVFDDPVNSLDYKRLQYVVSRLVDLSGSHQVIVFTHNIWFAAEILSHFDNAKAAADCTYYGVMEGDGAIGLVRRGTHPRWDTVAKLAKRVEELIRSAAQSTGETQSALIDSAYGVIRSWCEVVVETEILAGVTQRYQPNVMMTRLAEIKPDRLGAARDVLYPLFEKACRSMPDHSQPLETLSVRPTLNELKDDWQKAQSARAAYRA
jgi:hypothetical protein